MSNPSDHSFVFNAKTGYYDPPRTEMSDLERLHAKENEIARLMTENLQLRNRLKNAWDVCPYDQDGCLLENSEIGPCLCVNPVASPLTSNHSK